MWETYSSKGCAGNKSIKLLRVSIGPRWYNCPYAQFTSAASMQALDSAVGCREMNLKVDAQGRWNKHDQNNLPASSGLDIEGVWRGSDSGMKHTISFVNTLFTLNVIS